ncbi:hypothetical protein ACQRXC_28975 (plasmid) [Niallia taxi]|uniref:hypothetical protein n=1 Tax=Niallia taxi TaxID=2499688 RepID=UPI003F646AD7
MTVQYFQSKGCIVATYAPNQVVAHVPHSLYASAKQYLYMQEISHSVHVNPDYDSIVLFIFEGNLDIPEWDLQCDSLHYENYLYLLDYKELWIDDGKSQPKLVAMDLLPNLLRSSLEKALKEWYI